MTWHPSSMLGLGSEWHSKEHSKERNKVYLLELQSGYLHYLDFNEFFCGGCMDCLRRAGKSRST